MTQSDNTCEQADTLRVIIKSHESSLSRLRTERDELRLRLSDANKENARLQALIEARGKIDAIVKDANQKVRQQNEDSEIIIKKLLLLLLDDGGNIPMPSEIAKVFLGLDLKKDDT